MLEPLTLDVLDRALEEIGVRGVVRTPSGRSVGFGPWQDAPAFRLDVRLETEAPVLVVRVLPGVAFPLDLRPELLGACNAWHERYRWPRWHVAPLDGGVSVVGDLQLPCRFGLSHDQLVDLLQSIVAAARDFWSRIHDLHDPHLGVVDGLAGLLDAPLPPEPDDDIW